jgi:hypothetical protein
VDENVLAALARDEPEPAVVIEKLHFALHNETNYLFQPTNVAGLDRSVRARGDDPLPRAGPFVPRT